MFESTFQGLNKSQSGLLDMDFASRNSTTSFMPNLSQYRSGTNNFKYAKPDYETYAKMKYAFKPTAGLF